MLHKQRVYKDAARRVLESARDLALHGALWRPDDGWQMEDFRRSLYKCETVVRLIAGTTKAKGLKVTCRLDHRKYPVGRKITDEEFAHVNLKPDNFHGEWNYTIHPSNKRQL